MKLSERMDAKIAQLKENTARSRKVTAEVFSTAAKLAEDHSLMLQHLSLPTPKLQKSCWTVSTLRKEFETFKIARHHFKETYGVKANSWSILAHQVNIIETALEHLGLRERSS